MYPFLNWHCSLDCQRLREDLLRKANSAWETDDYGEQMATLSSHAGVSIS